VDVPVGENDGNVGRPHRHRRGGARVGSAHEQDPGEDQITRLEELLTAIDQKLNVRRRLVAGTEARSGNSGEDLALPSATPVAASDELGDASGTTVGSGASAPTGLCADSAPTVLTLNSSRVPGTTRAVGADRLAFLFNFLPRISKGYRLVCNTATLHAALVSRMQGSGDQYAGPCA
jgi:hypothetical protein